MIARNCEVCGKSQYRKKVWSKHGKKVICYHCAYDGWGFWPDGSTYDRRTGPTIEQQEYLDRRGAR
jgi:hypothetical protein